MSFLWASLAPYSTILTIINTETSISLLTIKIETETQKMINRNIEK